MTTLDFEPVVLPDSAQTLRLAVRAFLESQLQEGAFVPQVNSWLTGVDESFSRRLAQAGFIGTTIPREFGGTERGFLDRFVITEELLAAGAPVAAHWIADRQIAPNLVRFGSDHLKSKYLPRIAAGECFVALGMSEPDAGSDLASIRTRARRVDGGWRVTGTKVWTSGAHIASAMMTLVRTSDQESDHRTGLSQLLIDLPNPSVEIRPIISLDGHHHFNEVQLNDVFVPDSQVVGDVGKGWAQVTSELALERSGPERVMSTLPLLRAWIKALKQYGADETERAVAVQLLTRLVALRAMSLSVSASIARGEAADVKASLVKDLGTLYEGEVVEAIRRESSTRTWEDHQFDVLLESAVFHKPSFTLRGGTNEILRGMVARSMGVL